MHILVFCAEADRNLAEGLVSLITKRNIGAELCPLQPGWTPAQALPATDLSAATHLAAISAGSPLDTPWYGFVAGFSQGARLPLIGYGPAFPDLGPLPAGRGRSIRTEEEFAAWLTGEAEAWGRQEGRNRARQTLLGMGIPVSEESFQERVTEKNHEAAALFLEAGFSSNSRNAAGVSLLSLAVRAGDRDMTGLLLKAGADVNHRAADRGASALLDAALGKQHGIMADLLAAGADPDIKSKDGQPALIIAVGEGDETASALLLAAGADPDTSDSLGASARKYASLFHNSAMMALFNRYPPRQGK